MELARTTDEQLMQLFCDLGFVTASKALVPVLRLAQKAAVVSDITVLIEGETGTGKQVLAQAIHNLDEKRSGFPFVTVHCSTISEALAESELFGHEKGAFSGAVNARRGLFQAANKGTLFLDDINDLPMTLQPKLLDVIQRNVMRSVGSDREISTNARIIAAANQPLAPLVQQNRFRSDLYHRLNVVKLSVPPLRQRPEDLGPLLLAFARRHGNIYPNITHIDATLIQHIATQPLQGNIRELEHAVERMLFQKTGGSSLDLVDWHAQATTNQSQENPNLIFEAANCIWKAIFDSGLTYYEAMQQLERTLLKAALSQTGQTRRELAGRLGTSERTLYNKMRSHTQARCTPTDQALGR